MDFQKILQQLKDMPSHLKIIIVSVLIIAVALVFVVGIKGSSSSPKKVSGEGQETEGILDQEELKVDIKLITTDNIGKALEIQSALAKVGIRVLREENGSKSTLILPVKRYNGKKNTMSDRDRALLEIVKGGYVDQNVGLEIFDKGDFTSTKEDKRIRLSRAINGELSRLIRKIDPVQSASVFISIPEQTMFAADKKPVTATVQVVIPTGDRLPEIKVRAIENLLLGSVTGLTMDNISITDTNGNVYNSVIGAEDDILAKMQENDRYMTQKVQTQLNKLIGKGNYVVTVSTQLREAPLEKTSLVYDPQQKTAVSEQVFSEGLGDQTKDSSSSLNAVSTYLPNGLPAGGSNSAQSRSYARSAKETQYGVTKTQVSEYLKPGVIEEISIAVTLDQSAIPVNVSLEELRMLIASAASPRASVDNVTIAFSDSIDPFLASDKPTALPKPDASGNPWWLVGVMLLILLGSGFYILGKRLKADAARQRDELQQIKEKSVEQERQLQDVNLKAAELIEKQSQLAQNILEQRAQVMQQPQQVAVAEQPQPTRAEAVPELAEALDELTEDIDYVDEDELANEMQSWIERS